MTALVLIAHGSRRKASNQEVGELAARLEGIAGDHFDRSNAPQPDRSRR